MTDVKTRASHRGWTPERIARLTALIAFGHPSDRIAVDPIINTSERNVRRQSTKRNISIRDTRLQAPIHVVDLFMRAAAVRNTDARSLAIQLLGILGDEPGLLDNILDDGFTTPMELQDV